LYDGRIGSRTTGKERDAESGNDYFMARYYDSRTGTFCSADPLAGDPSDPQSWNRYPYGRNDPIDMTDPSGKHWWNWLLDAGAIAAMVFQPEIDGFLSSEWSALFGSSAAADSSFTPVLLTRTAAQATSTIAEGAGDAAAAGSGGWSGGLALSAAAAQATDQPKQHNQTPINMGAAVTAAQNTLSKNCDSAFKKTMPNYTNSGFFKSLASTAFQQYPAGTPNIPSHAFGADADTLINSPGRPIRLFPNFYGDSVSYGLGVIVHEGIHHFTGWTDDQVFQHFFKSGLRHPNPGTDDITNWIKNGCPPAK
jgi:RHS repeat-associated protein